MNTAEQKRWSALYLDNPDIAARGVKIEEFLHQPAEIFEAVVYGRALPLDPRPLLPAQRAVQERLDAVSEGSR